MSRIPDLKALVLRDTPFAQLMNKRIYNVLLIATKYDAFMLEDDGRVDEQVFNEYTPPSASAIRPASPKSRPRKRRWPNSPTATSSWSS